MFNINLVKPGSLDDWQLLTSFYVDQRNSWERENHSSEKPYFYFNPSENRCFEKQFTTNPSSTLSRDWYKLTFLDIHSIICRDSRVFKSEAKPNTSYQTLSNLIQFYEGVEIDINSKLQSWNPLDILCQTIQKIVHWFQGRGWISHHHIYLELISNQKRTLTQAQESIVKSMQNFINTQNKKLDLPAPTQEEVKKTDENLSRLIF